MNRARILRQLIDAGILGLAFLLGVSGGVTLDRRVLSAFVPTRNIPTSATNDFALMAEAWNTIDRFYVDPTHVQPQELTYGAIAGMVNALGDTGHSRFLNPTMKKMFAQLERNKFEGIGAEIQMKDGRAVIVAPIDGSPAQRAGVRPGDEILRVDGVAMTGLPLDQIVSRIAGKPGTTVTLTLLTPATNQTRDLTITRAVITIHNVQWCRLPGTSIVHLHVVSFSQDAAADLRKALTAIEREHLTGLVFDLRNNPGGLLNEAVNSASEFLSTGGVVEVKDAHGKTKTIPVKPGGIARSVPLVVLVNAGSASAAEIVAGALQDAGRGPLVGEKTFGTGTVLSQFNLTDGSALMLAVEEWLTPKGHLIWHKGITPDVVVSLPADTAPLFPSAETELTSAQLQATSDRQLARALTILQTHPEKKSGPGVTSAVQTRYVPGGEHLEEQS